jgi:hypothetical protein
MLLITVKIINEQDFESLKQDDCECLDIPVDIYKAIKN